MSQVSSLHTKAKCYNFSVFKRKHKRHLCRNVWTQSKQRKCITTAAFAEKKQNCCSITKSNETVKTSFDVSISIFFQFFKRRLEQQQQKFKMNFLCFYSTLSNHLKNIIDVAILNCTSRSFPFGFATAGSTSILFIINYRQK